MKSNSFSKVLSNTTNVIGLDIFGELYSWGISNEKLGRESSPLFPADEILNMPNITNTIVSDIACGENYFMKICNNYVYTWGKGDYGELGKSHFNDLSNINIYPEIVSFYETYIQASYIFGMKYSAFASSFDNKDFFAWGKNSNNECYYNNLMEKNTFPYLYYFKKDTKINDFNDNYITEHIWNNISTPENKSELKIKYTN